MRTDWLEILGPKLASVSGAVAGGVGAGVVMLGDALVQLLGVPLPVVVASAAGAAMARAFLDTIGFWRALWITALWTVLGCAGAPLAQALGPALVQAALNREVTLPANTLAALGSIIGAAPWWWPKVWPLVAAKFSKGGANAKP